MKNISKIAFLSALLFFFLNSVFASTAPQDSSKNELKGNIESKKGKTVKVSITETTSLPAPGTSGTLSKYFDEEVLGMHTHGYIDIAEVEVKDVTESEVTFTVIKELTNVKINGKKENLIKKGIIIKFEWTP